MDVVLNWLWQGCAIALATLLMLRLLERSRAQARYLLSAAALLTIVLLPVVSLMGVASSPMQALTVSALAPGPAISVPNEWWTSSTVVIAGWALWSSVYGARVFGAMVALRRARRRCRPFPSALEARLQHWAEVRGQSRGTSLMLSDDVRAAAVLGCGRPVIAVAPRLVQQLSADELDRVVIHEWAHVQRRDDVANIVQLTARMIAGWHPAVWWLDRRLQVEREVACDETTVALTGFPKRYAACLTKLASLRPLRLDMLPSVGALSSPALATRIAKIVSQRRVASRAWSTGTATAAAVLVGALSLAVGGLRLVETAALPPELDATPASTQVQRVQPNGIETSARTFQAPPPKERPQHTSVRTAPRAAGVSVLEMSAASESVEAASDSTPAARPPEHSAPAYMPDLVAFPPATDGPPEGGPDIRNERANSSPVLHSPSGTSPAAPDAQRPSSWGAAANAGAAVSRGSKKAGLATAGFFSRFGQQLADSF